MTVDLVPLMAVLASATVVIGGVFAGLRWLGKKLDKRMQEVAIASKATQAQLETSDDKTIADHVQESSREITSINGHIETLMKFAEQNRSRSIRAEMLAEHAHDRLDKHLANDHGFHVSPKNQKEN
jgi:outer membrane murein-binding lipoprotein Lpp